MSEQSHNFTAYRQQINDIDRQLVSLLNQRARLALQIGALKHQSGAPIYDAGREGEVLDRATRVNTGPLSVGAIHEIMSTIMTACREIQIKG